MPLDYIHTFEQGVETFMDKNNHHDAENSEKIWIEPVTEMMFQKIPGGSFLMGSPSEEERRHSNEGPVHEVELDGFWMGKFPVTLMQWEKVMGNELLEADQHTIEFLRNVNNPISVKSLVGLINFHFCLHLLHNNEWENHPVNWLAWFDSMKFIEKINLGNSQ